MLEVSNWLGLMMLGSVLCHQFLSADHELKGYSFCHDCLTFFFLPLLDAIQPVKPHMITLVQK